MLIWLGPKTVEGLQKRTIEIFLAKRGIHPNKLKILYLTNLNIEAVKARYSEAKVLVINSLPILKQIAPEAKTLHSYRGSLFIKSGLPCIVVDDLYKLTSINDKFTIFWDLTKIARFYNHEINYLPPLQYTICDTLPKIKQAFRAFKDKPIAIDIETHNRAEQASISVIGHYDGERAYIVPLARNGQHIHSIQELEDILKFLQTAYKTQQTKIYQNGTYDLSYFIKYRFETEGQIFDTAVAWHSMYAEQPKTLNHISSVLLDTYKQWKNMTKDGYFHKTYDNDYYQTLLKYNAYDCYYTYWNAVTLMQGLQTENYLYARNNYNLEMKQKYGPAFAMTMRGMACDVSQKDKFAAANAEASEKSLEHLKVLIKDETFNPNSTKDMPNLIYNILQASPIPRQKRNTCDEKVLKLIATQNPLYKTIIEAIWATKKPANLVSKYGESLVLLNGRFMYSLQGASTKTSRYSSSEHNFWAGTNIQNLPYSARLMLIPDKGYILFEMDYGQADAWFTAFTLEDEQMMELMLSPKDAHCYHAAMFFKLSEEALIEAKNNHESWCTHNITGIRSITKRVVYGANYLMTGMTLLITMGQDAMDSAAKNLNKDTKGWNYIRYAQFGQALLNNYFTLYSTLKAHLTQHRQQAISNDNKYTVTGGFTRKYLGSLSSEVNKRDFASLIGQAGTACNINKAGENLYFDKKYEEGKDWMLLSQTHDSFTGQIKVEHFHRLIPIIKSGMQNICHAHGREFLVPVDISVGLRAGKGLQDYKESLTYEDLLEYDRQFTSS